MKAACLFVIFRKMYGTKKKTKILSVIAFIKIITLRVTYCFILR